MFRMLQWAIPLAVLVAIGAAGAGIYRYVRSQFPDPPAPEITVRSEGLWAIMRTPGGLLEVSTIQSPAEVIERKDFGRLGPFDFGTNVSQVRVAATFRYHIPLAPEWKVVTRDGTIVVVAPKVRPTLPVAFDSSKVDKKVDAGWLRFDKAESLRAAESAVTEELAKRAGSPGAINQQREVARQTVTEFVRKWAVKQDWKGRAPNVRVVFADEPIESLGNAAVTFSGL